MTFSVSSLPLWPQTGSRREPLPWLKPGIFWGGLMPLAALIWRGMNDSIGADPIAIIENELGLSALVFLIASLACTPARWLFGWTWPIRVRRQVGLFAFFYATLHFSTYLFLDQQLDFGAILGDIAQRPFITVGFLALVILTPIAWTSTTEWIVKLGYKRWQRLHQLVYVAGALAVIHFIWRVKLDVSQPLTYAFILATLLSIRGLFWLRKRFIDE